MISEMGKDRFSKKVHRLVKFGMKNMLMHCRNIFETFLIFSKLYPVTD